MRFGIGILFLGGLLAAITRQTPPVVSHDRMQVTAPAGKGGKILTLPQADGGPPVPLVGATEPTEASSPDPRRAAILGLLEVVDDDTRDALLRYYVKAGFPLTDLPVFSRPRGPLPLADDAGTRFYVIARPGETLRVDPGTGDLHNLHGEDINVAFPPGRHDAWFVAPREPGAYRYRCDVHNGVLGWVVVVP